MRSLADNSGLTPVQVDDIFPFGAIIDQTDSVSGTAVIGEIYNDILVNCYKALQEAGIITSTFGDNEDTGYQLLQAWRSLINTIVDVEQPMTLASTIYSVPVNLSLLPNKCVLICKATGAYNPATTYTFKGSGSSPSYPFTSPTGFNDGDEVVVIINTAGVRAYSVGGGSVAGGSQTFTAGDLLGLDPFFYLPLAGTAVPKVPKYLTMYIKNGDGDSQNKMISPVPYVSDTRIITGMPSPADWPDQVIKLYFS